MRRLFHSRSGRCIALGLLLLAVALLSVGLWNARHIRADAFNRSAQALIERSRHIREQAGPEYPSEVLSTLRSNAHNGPFFRFDDMMDSATERLEPTRPTNLQPPVMEFALEFDEGETTSIISTEGKSTVEFIDGMLVVRQEDEDYVTNKQPIDIRPDQVGEIVIRARAKKARHLTLAWAKELHPKNPWKHKLDIPIVSDNQFHTYVIDNKDMLNRGAGNGRSIRRIFLKPSNMDGARVEIDFIRFLSKASKYERHPRGVAYESIGGELRRVLYMLPSQMLEYSLVVPEKSPVFDFGAAVLVENEPVIFQVSISDALGETKLYNEEIAGVSEWTDARLDLTRWAGKDVRIRIGVTGSPKNVAFWSNPILWSEPRQRFNVIVILEDALRADYLSTYGYGLPTSPVKDQLMQKQGVVFANAISQATQTRASVASLMTSLLPSATGVWDEADMLSEQYLTVAEVMRRQGFATASFIQNGNAGPQAGLHQGFSKLLDHQTIGGTTEGIFGEGLHSWLEENRDRNFFLYLHVIDPHGVYAPPPPFDEWYRGAADGTGDVSWDSRFDATGIEHPTKEGRRSLYAGEVRHNDSVLPSFIKRLETLGIHDETLIVFTSDHGEYLGENGMWGHGPPGYLKVTHVPLMLQYPGRFKKSQKISELAQLLDIAPTILELAGVDMSRLLLQGDSLVDLVEGHGNGEWKDRIVISEEPTKMSKIRPFRNRGLFVCGSLLWQDWHFIASRAFWPYQGYLMPEALRMKVFCFSRDCEEEHQLYSYFFDLYHRYKFTSVLSKVQTNNAEAHAKWTIGSEDTPHEIDPDTSEQLRALGYL